jgi:hypothetical protein
VSNAFKCPYFLVGNGLKWSESKNQCLEVFAVVVAGVAGKIDGGTATR